MSIFGIPSQAWLGQILLGLVNRSFYAVMSLGLAVIFGMLNIINFVHGAIYMLGAFGAWMALNWLGLGYWWSLLLAPLALGIFGVILERTLLRRLYNLDRLYGLLLAFGLSLILEGGVFRDSFGVSGQAYPGPELLSSATDVGFMVLPKYRAWVVGPSLVVCFATWILIEKTRIGSYLRAGTENAKLLASMTRRSASRRR